MIGALISFGGAAVVLQWFRSGRQPGSRAFALALVLVGLGFNVMLIPSRLYNNLGGGLPSRYTTMTWPLVVGIGLALLTWHGAVPRFPRRAVVLRGFALVLVIAQVYFATSLGIAAGKGQVALRRTSADILANVQTAPNYLILPYLFPGASYVRGLAAFLEKNRMSVFEGSTASSLRQLGIVPGGELTRLAPKSATVRTWTRLDADAEKAWVVLSAIYVGSGSYLAPDVTSTSSEGLINWAVAQPPPSAIAMSFWSPPPAAVFLAPYATIYAAWAAEESWRSYSDLAVPVGLRGYVSTHPMARLAWNVLSGLYANDPILRQRFTTAEGRALLNWAAEVGSLPEAKIAVLIPLRPVLVQMAAIA